MFFVYMIKNSINKLYVGISKNPDERVIYHNSKLGARFTTHIPNFKLVFLEEYATPTKAHQREIQIKKWRREKKERLINRYQQNLPTKI